MADPVRLMKVSLARFAAASFTSAHVAQTTETGTIPAMSMPTKIGDTTFFSIEEAGKIMGCTPSWVRQLCRAGKLEGALRHGQRSWLVPEKSAKAVSKQLTGRAIGKKAKK